MFVLLCSVLCVVCLMCVDCRCAQTLFYKSCWIRRVPARDVDVEESVRRGALILQIYHEDTARRCSTTCCTTHNFSCSLAVFHYNTTRDSVNCFHLHCSNPDSCVLHHRRNVILYNVTKGVDPDLLVFGKHFTTNVRVLPHMSSSRLNASEPLTSDKRHFNHPPNPPVRSISPASTSTTKPTSPHQTSRDVSTASENHLAGCTTKPASPADERTTPQIILTTQINPHSQHALTSQVTSSHLLHTTQPTDSTPHITQTDTFTSAPSPAQSSFTVTSIIPPSELQTYSPPGTLSTQQPLELQTTTQRNYIKTTSITERPPPATSLSTITSTTIKEFSQTITQNEMTDTQTHPSSPSKSLTSPNPQTATQTNVPSQTMTHNNTTTTVLPPTTASQAEETTSTFTVSSASSPTITTIRHVTLNFTRMRDSPSSPSSSVSGPTSSSSSRVDSQPYPNDTKGYISRNISTDESASPAADGGLTSVWRLAANTVLVALVTCVTVTFGCCCSVFAALRWRGRRRRKGRYRTDLRRQRGSMKLIKYVIVRESS